MYPNEELSFEHRTYKIVEMCVYRVVSVISAINVVPYMRYAILCEAVMIAVRCRINNLVVAACCDEQEVWLFAALPVKTACSTWCRADSSDIAEQVRALHTNEERLASAH